MKRLFLALMLGLGLSLSALAKDPNYLNFDSTLSPPASVQLEVTDDAFKLAPNGISQERLDEQALKVVGNAEIKSTLLVRGSQIAISGRTSMYFEATEEDLRAGLVNVGGFNLAYFNVPQQPLTDEVIRGAKTGVLGFTLDHASGPQYLKYDPRESIIYGQLRGYIDAGYMADLTAPQTDGKRDFVETPKQQAVVQIQMELERPLILEASKDKVARQQGSLSLQLEAFQVPDRATFEYAIKLEKSPVMVGAIAVWWFEIAKRLCIQPVRVASIKWFPLSIELTGDGLAFGMPGARKQWATADVVFSVNDWITLWAPQYTVLSSGEAASLRSEVNKDDCVEVFFVDALSPESMWGGGATWGLGTAGTKIISSDGNADNGIDLTHLAHELGHSIGLPHPDGSPGVSTGTLMCPSGWMRDNPRRNSQENKDNISNPLFTFALKAVSPGPDCNNSADCGSCYVIYP